MKPTSKPKRPIGCKRRRTTNLDRLISTLVDGRWHSTRELRRRVGPNFHLAKFKLVRSGIPVERRKHSRRRGDFQYRVDINELAGHISRNRTSLEGQEPTADAN